LIFVFEHQNLCVAAEPVLRKTSSMEMNHRLKPTAELQVHEDEDKEANGTNGRSEVQYRATQRLDV
jgi:hypothetical protein